MDTAKIGKFLKELRKENGLTQEQLGEKVGVTNKTVSRWENGNYLPPAESLAMLSDIYGISINEILSGQRLTTNEFASAADDNLKGTLEQSEQLFKSSERALLIMWGISAVLTMLLLFLIPTENLALGKSFLLIFLVGILGFISNVLSCVSILLNKERFHKH